MPLDKRAQYLPLSSLFFPSLNFQSTLSSHHGVLLSNILNSLPPSLPAAVLDMPEEI
jgi:hypothetical protein